MWPYGNWEGLKKLEEKQRKEREDKKESEQAMTPEKKAPPRECEVSSSSSYYCDYHVDFSVGDVGSKGATFIEKTAYEAVKAELAQVIKIGVEGQREINRQLSAENKRQAEAIEKLKEQLRPYDKELADRLDAEITAILQESK